jgi:uncharacterized Zn finger protein
MNNNVPNMPQPAGLTYNQTESINCEKCNSEIFQPVFLLRKVSALVSPSGKETVVPVQVFACQSCGHVNEDMYPVE